MHNPGLSWRVSHAQLGQRKHPVMGPGKVHHARAHSKRPNDLPVLDHDEDMSHMTVLLVQCVWSSSHPAPLSPSGFKGSHVHPTNNPAPILSGIKWADRTQSVSPSESPTFSAPAQSLGTTTEATRGVTPKIITQCD